MQELENKIAEMKHQLETLPDQIFEAEYTLAKLRMEKKKEKEKKMNIDKKYYIVQLDEGVWLAKWEGDPGRTLVEESAAKFVAKPFAQAALERTRRKYPERKFKNAKIVECEEV